MRRLFQQSSGITSFNPFCQESSQRTHFKCFGHVELLTQWAFLSPPCAGLMGDSDHPYSKFENEWSGRSGGAESSPSLLASGDASVSHTSPPDGMLDPRPRTNLLWFTRLIISNLTPENWNETLFCLSIPVLSFACWPDVESCFKSSLFFFFPKWSHDLSLFTSLVWYWTAICTHSIDLLNKDVCKGVLVKNLLIIKCCSKNTVFFIFF